MRKRNRICLVCGKHFLGNAAANTCGSSCRTELSRLKAAKKRPEYILLAKSNGQKIPDLTAPKRLKFKKGEKKQDIECIGSTVIYTPVTPASFDCEKADKYILDEAGMTAPITPMTKEEKEAMKRGLEKQIENIKKESLPAGVHPKTFILTKQVRVSEIEEQIKMVELIPLKTN